MMPMNRTAWIGFGSGYMCVPFGLCSLSLITLWHSSVLCATDFLKFFSSGVSIGVTDKLQDFAILRGLLQDFAILRGLLLDCLVGCV